MRLAPEDGEVLVLVTGGDGVAYADTLPPATYDVSASAPDHEPAAARPVVLAAGADEKVAIALAAGGRALTGVVTDVSGGPIAGARIDAARAGGMARPDRAIATTMTSADGRYRLTVAEGPLFVGARSPDYAAQSRLVEVGAGGATADFALVPGGVIEGVVLDDKTRRPVAGAAVTARRDASTIALAEARRHGATAGPDGRFRIAGLRPGAYELDARHGARRTQAATLVGLGVAEQLGDVELLVGAGLAIRGRVVGEDGAAIAGAKVQALGDGRGREVEADAAGAFVLDGLAPGNYLLLGRGDTAVPGPVTRVRVEARDVGGVVVTARRGAKLRGRVAPPQVCEIRLELEHALGQLRGGAIPFMLAPVTSAADGAFELGPVPHGPLALAARCRSGARGRLEVAAAQLGGELVVEVTPGAAIAGRVVDGKGKPVAGVTVMAAATRGGTETTTVVNGVITSGVQTVTTAAGAYELVGLDAGTYHVTALEHGRPLRLRGKAPSVTLGATDRKTGVDVAVDRPDGVIAGVVTGPDGQPLADAWVSVHVDLAAMLEQLSRARREADGGSSRMMVTRDEDDGGAAAGGIAPVLTDAQGRFAITGLPHATYEVVAEAQAGGLRGRRANVTPDATIAITALGVTSLSGTVRGPSGPTALFTLELDGPTRTTRTFANGAFELARVDPGAYTIRVTSSDGNAEAKLDIPAGAPAKVDLVLAANAVVIGTVVDPAGKPLAGVPVVVVPDTGDGRVSVSLDGPPPTSGPDGSFRVEHKAGAGMLVVMTPPRPVTRPGLALEAGKTLDVGEVRLEPPEPPQPPP